MTKHTPVRSAYRNALSLVIMGVLWLLFAPRQLGGQVSYVIVDGSSMLPRFHKGDFVLVRQAAEYPVGTIVTYRYPGIGPVIHRIVGRSGSKYVLKGDNNTWEDGYQPALEEIIGAYWTHLPGAGYWVARMRSPVWFSLLAGVAALLVGLSMQTSAQPEKQFRRSAAAAAAAAAAASGQLNRWVVSWRDGMLTLVFMLGLAGGLLLIFGWTRPVTRRATLEIPLTQSGSYRYGARVPDGVYDQNRLDSGGPIFPQLNCTVNLLFNYSIASQDETRVEGTHHLIAVVSSTKGWKRSLEMEPETAFSGSQAEAGGTLDLCAAQQMIADMQNATGVQELQYQLAVYPQVQVKGSLGVLTFTDQFNAPLVFVMEPRQVYVQRERDDQAALTRTQPGLVSGQLIVDNTLPVFSLALPVRAARILGIAALLLAGAGLVWVEAAAHTAETRDPRRKLAHRVGRPPVRVDPAAFSGRETVRMENLDDLAALAQQVGAPILYTETGGNLAFLVEAGGIIYRCEPGQAAP